MLRYLQPVGDEVNLDFLTKQAATTDYVEALFGVGLNPSTVNNYLKNMGRFLKFLETDVNISAEMTALTSSSDATYRFKLRIDMYRQLIHDLQKPVYKDIASALCRKRYIDHHYVYVVFFLFVQLYV